MDEYAVHIDQIILGFHFLPQVIKKDTMIAISMILRLKKVPMVNNELTITLKLWAYGPHRGCQQE
jgi:hypothetical protein